MGPVHAVQVLGPERYVLAAQVVHVVEVPAQPLQGYWQPKQFCEVPPVLVSPELHAMHLLEPSSLKFGLQAEHWLFEGPVHAEHAALQAWQTPAFR